MKASAHFDPMIKTPIKIHQQTVVTVASPDNHYQYSYMA